MDHKDMNIMALMVIATLFGGQYLVRGVGANVAEVERGFCLDSCMRGCKGTGVSSIRCFKYCGKHCPAPAAAASIHKSSDLHYCKLGCMLVKCSEFSQDEAKQDSCVRRCELNECSR